VLIQFGHNDQPGKPGRSTDLATEFPANMAGYVAEARAAGAIPILVTPLVRRRFAGFRLRRDLEPWAEATRRVAAERHAPLLDLHADSLAAVESMGPVEANLLAQAPPPSIVLATQSSGDSVEAPPAPPNSDPAAPRFDYTHLGARGADVFSAMVARELARAAPDVAPYVGQTQ
jgi:lysophospholipase L1-like esterase